MTHISVYLFLPSVSWQWSGLSGSRPSFQGSCFRHPFGPSDVRGGACGSEWHPAVGQGRVSTLGCKEEFAVGREVGVWAAFPPVVHPRATGKRAEPRKGAGSIGPPQGSPPCFPRPAPCPTSRSQCLHLLCLHLGKGDGNDTQLLPWLGGRSEAPVFSGSNSFWPTVGPRYMFAVFINLISGGFNLVPLLGVLSL